MVTFKLGVTVESADVTPSSTPPCENQIPTAIKKNRRRNRPAPPGNNMK